MNSLKTLSICFLSAVLFGLTLRCGDTRLAGNTSELDNPVITGSLYTSGGSKAAGAIVHVRPKNTLADTARAGSGSLGDIKVTVIADKNGQYTINTLGSGDYVIEATDGKNNIVLIDSVVVDSSGTTKRLPPDTLRPAGAIKGIIKLEEGGDPRKVFVLAFGLDRFALPDSQGRFIFLKLAKGKYDLRFLPSLYDYGVLDTTGVVVGTGDTTDLDTVRLPFKGIPTPKGVSLSYDTLRQTVVLSWKKMNPGLVDGFNIYRSINRQNFSLLTKTPLPDSAISYRDSTVDTGALYEYRVVSRKSSGEESRMIDLPNDTLRPVPTALVSTTLQFSMVNTISDTASINDTIRFCLHYANPTRKIRSVSWFVDSADSALRQRRDSLLAGNDTLVYSRKDTGTKTVSVKLVDAAGTVWNGSRRVTIVQDVPTVSISGNGTVPINRLLSLAAQTNQKFGSIVKYRWDNGIAPGYDDSTGATYAPKYLAEGTFSVKVQVEDDDGNTAVASKTVLVVNDAPVVKGLNDTTISINDTVHFSVIATTSNGVQRYYWNFGDGSEKQHDTTASPVNAHVFPSTAKICTVSVAAVDSFGKAGSQKARVTVVVDAPVVQMVTDTIIEIKSQTVFRIGTKQQFGSVVMYKWDFNGDGVWEDSGSTLAEDTITYPSGGVTSVAVLVRDDDGNETIGHTRVLAGTFIKTSEIIGDMTFAKALSPYILFQNTVFDAWLTIEAGVEVRIANNAYLRTMENLIAIGNPKDSITFTALSDAPGARWGKLDIVGPATLRYCNFRHAVQGVQGSLSADAENCTADSCSIGIDAHRIAACTARWCDVIGLAAGLTELSKASHCGIGIRGSAIGCIVDSNQTGITSGNIDSCFISHNVIGAFNASKMYNSKMVANNYGCYGTRGSIYKCLISQNTLAGIYGLKDNIHYCIISGNSTGIDSVIAGYIYQNDIDNIAYNIIVRDRKPAPVHAENNYWGAATTEEMESKGPEGNIRSIEDFYDNNFGYKVIFFPWLTAPVTNAGPDW